MEKRYQGRQLRERQTSGTLLPPPLVLLLEFSHELRVNGLAKIVNSAKEFCTKDPDYIGDITGLHGQFQEGASRWVLFDKDGKVVTVANTAPTGDAPGVATEGQQWKQLVVSKVFDNEDFGYHKITVERPLRLNFHATPERLAGLEDETAFKNLATSTKKDEAARLAGIAAGEQRQHQVHDLLAEFAKRHPEQINDRKVFLDRLKPVDRELNVRLSAPELKAVVSALSERDETAEICRNRDGEAEPDAGSRHRAPAGRGHSMMAHTLGQPCVPEARFFLALGHAFAYNCLQQHPPRLSVMRTRGVTFLGFYHARKPTQNPACCKHLRVLAGFLCPPFGQSELADDPIRQTGADHRSASRPPHPARHAHRRPGAGSAVPHPHRLLPPARLLAAL